MKKLFVLFAVFAFVTAISLNASAQDKTKEQKKETSTQKSDVKKDDKKAAGGCHSSGTSNTNSEKSACPHAAKCAKATPACSGKSEEKKEDKPVPKKD